MNVNEIMQYLSYAMLAIGIMAFIVSIITQVIKSWPGLDVLPTQAVVIVLSLLLCPLLFIMFMAWRQQPIAWWMLLTCFLTGFVVALVSMDGWERLREIWDRTKYKEK